ncbi:hypothetical protein HHK36_009916 [Tetracentron sinense]|uniref:Uncharacterized protein n=1 Tax=Tetracentron sinense TaxID=13715 RepID=A0A834ZDI6_TETSI|nr:hypothetical protein HHK36_009916 [Tetracentron sinense]
MGKGGGRFEAEASLSVSSPVTRQEVVAAKIFIENHYKNYLQGLHDHKERNYKLHNSGIRAKVPTVAEVTVNVKIDEMMRFLKETSEAHGKMLHGLLRKVAIITSKIKVLSGGQRIEKRERLHKLFSTRGDVTKPMEVINDHNIKRNDRGFPVAEPMSTEWTDEKHSLYLNFMEASFVNQLYCSMDLLGWWSQENPPDANTSRPSNANTRISSGKFKVLREGCGQKINFERTQPPLDIADESQVLVENPWIRHFRSGGKCQNGTSPNLQEYGSIPSETIQLRVKKTLACGLATSSKQLPVCHSHLCRQDSVGSNTGLIEVSDQNFIDEDHEGEKLSSLCRAKRMKTLVGDASSKDQVVPFGKSHVTADSTENDAFSEKE